MVFGTKITAVREKDPRGIEADGNMMATHLRGTPQSNFVVDGVTFEFKAAPSTDMTLVCQDVIKIRRGATATKKMPLSRSWSSG